MEVGSRKLEDGPFDLVRLRSPQVAQGKKLKVEG